MELFIRYLNKSRHGLIITLLFTLAVTVIAPYAFTGNKVFFDFIIVISLTTSLVISIVHLVDYCAAKAVVLALVNDISKEHDNYYVNIDPSPDCKGSPMLKITVPNSLILYNSERGAKNFYNAVRDNMGSYYRINSQLLIYTGGLISIHVTCLVYLICKTGTNL